MKELEIKARAEAEAEARQLEMRAKEMEYQLQMKQLELTAQNNNNNNSNNEGNLSKVDIKKFPQFRKGDCPETFLIAFEWACRDFNVRGEERMVMLRSQIRES